MKTVIFHLSDNIDGGNRCQRDEQVVVTRVGQRGGEN